MTPNQAASVRARLLNLARSRSLDFNQVLVQFALERILYRLASSPYRDRYLLKGALLFLVWYDMPHRPTRDADLLGFGDSDLTVIAQTFRDIASQEADDGMTFDPESVTVNAIRKEAGYPGVRVVLRGELAGARCRIQIDIGFGDAVTPAAQESDYPILLTDLPAPRLRTYPVYTVIAEKLDAIVLLGMANTRLKDYLDLWVLMEREELDPTLLAQAVLATFARRAHPLPAAVPTGLTAAYARDPEQQQRWQSFLARNRLEAPPLEDVVDLLREALAPVLEQARTLQGSPP